MTAPGKPRLVSVTGNPRVRSSRAAVKTYPLLWGQSRNGVRQGVLDPTPVTSLAPMAAYLMAEPADGGAVGAVGLSPLPCPTLSRAVVPSHAPIRTAASP